MTITAATMHALWDSPEEAGPSVEFTVRGLPTPQGNARAFIVGRGGPKARAILATDSNRPNTPIGAWRSAIRNEAQRAMGDRDLFAVPLSIEVEFLMPRPKSHYRSDGATVKPNAPRWHSGRGDIDKHLRSALDAMTAVVYVDDGLVAVVRASKPYGAQPGCHVVVRAL